VAKTFPCHDAAIISNVAAAQTLQVIADSLSIALVPPTAFSPGKKYSGLRSPEGLRATSASGSFFFSIIQLSRFVFQQYIMGRLKQSNAEGFGLKNHAIGF
jgi:hypothetical protein